MLPPGPKGLPIFGSLFAFTRDMPGFLVGLNESYGSLASFRVGRRPVINLAEPELIGKVLVDDADSFIKSYGLQRAKVVLGEGLLTSEGEFHLRQRRLSSKAFLKKRIDAYADTMVSFTQRHAGEWREGQTIDLAHHMMELTLRIVSKTLFDTDSATDVRTVGEAMTALQELFPWLLTPYTRVLEKLPVPGTLRFRRARAGLDSVIYRILAERRANPEDRGDLLSMLMLATDDEGDGSRMSDLQLRDEVLTIFLAGHETTATALAWTGYLLCLHPHHYARLLAEVDDVLRGRAARAEDYGRLEYTRQVVAESMRLYPPAWGMGRMATRDYPLGDYVLPAGGTVLASPFVLGRDARFFPEPLVFDPSRFSAEQEKARPRHVYFPFGAGKRKCLGERFAWMEAVLVLATLSQQWRFHYDRGAPVRYRAAVTLRPHPQVPVRLSRRETVSTSSNTTA
ncbi:MAG: cytochrome P450 [Vulcanimicrobiota bacterium]